MGKKAVGKKVVGSKIEDNKQDDCRFRRATLDDVDALEALEQESFDHDRLSRRSLRHWVKVPHAVLLLAEDDEGLLGYGLVWLHKGTRLARLYSLAVAARAQGRGLGTGLLTRLEQLSLEADHFFMRLEVAKSNHAAIALYEKLGYRVFGEYSDYYEDHSDALRMQKSIRPAPSLKTVAAGFPSMPWYQQTTEFTCGPAALMMAMSSQAPGLRPGQELELDIWREATTIFMTSGHGGCHPLGLALSARRRGFVAEAYISTDRPLFTEGVRNPDKKKIIALVHEQFVRDAREQSVSIVYKDITQTVLGEWLENGYSVLVLISTYRLDGKKAPHWVCVTYMDEHCLYVHDPDLSEGQQLPLDCQHMPIAREDFARMSAFGADRLRTAIAIKRQSARQR